MAKAIGQLWGALEPDEKKVYEDQAAAERARVARDTQRLKDAGLWPAAGAAGVGGLGCRPSIAASGRAGGASGPNPICPERDG